MCYKSEQLKPEVHEKFNLIAQVSHPNITKKPLKQHAEINFLN